MASICFLTFYDLICIGPRLLSSTLKENGHKASLVIFKGERSFWIKLPVDHRTKIKEQQC